MGRILCADVWRIQAVNAYSTGTAGSPASGGTSASVAWHRPITPFLRSTYSVNWTGENSHGSRRGFPDPRLLPRLLFALHGLRPHRPARRRPAQGLRLS